MATQKRTTTNTVKKGTRKKTAAAAAETTAAAQEAVTAVADKEEITASKLDQVAAENAELKAQIAAMMEKMEALQKPQVVTIANDVEKVYFMWQAPVSDDNVVTFGEHGMFGRITGKTGTFYVPKTDLSRMLDAPTRHFLDLRWLIALSGLDEDERKAYGVDYKDGEILDKGAFSKLTEIGDEILDIYPGLCKSHKEMVTKLYYEAFKNGKEIKRDTVAALYKMDSNEAFKAIISEMNDKELNA